MYNYDKFFKDYYILQVSFSIKVVPGDIYYELN